MRFNELFMTPPLRAVIFDVDGTLYDQTELRRLLARDLIVSLFSRRLRVSDLRVLRNFHRIRERLSRSRMPHIEKQQYSLTASLLDVPVRNVEAIVREWLLERPLLYLSRLRWPGVIDLFDALRSNGFGIGICSDYPADEKMQALGLRADTVVCTSDADIDLLKPDPAGLLCLAARMKTPAEECLMIGDRDEKDGEAARRAGMRYLIVRRRQAGHFFYTLRDAFLQSRQSAAKAAVHPYSSLDKARRML